MSDFLQELHEWVTGNLVYHNIPIDPVTIVHGCEVADFTISGGAQNETLNSTKFIHNANSLNLGKNVVNAFATYFINDLGVQFDGTGKNFHVWLNIIDAAMLAKIHASIIGIRMEIGSDDSNGFTLDVLQGGLAVGRNKLGGDLLTDFTTVGTPDITALDFIRLQIVTTSSSVLFSLGDLWMDLWHFSEDGSWEILSTGDNTFYPLIDTVDFIESGQSWQAGNCASGQSSIGYKVLLTDPINMQSMNAGIFAKLADTSQFNAASAMQISFGNDDINNVYTKSVPASVFTDGEWIRIGDLLTDMVLTGSVDTKAINFIQVEWQLLDTSIVIPLGDIKFDYPNYGPAASMASASTFYNYMPETPISIISLYNLSGSTRKAYPIDKQIIRVLARGDERSDAKDLADQLYKLVHLGNGSSLSGLTLTDFYVYNLIARSRPQQAGVDKNSNKLYTFDIEANIREI